MFWKGNNTSCIMEISHGYGYKTAFIFVVMFGILGNVLVILSMLKQRRLLRNNFYYLVFHVTICDLSYLLLSIYQGYFILSGKSVSYSNCVACITFRSILDLYLILGAYFMLVISVIRYRAVLHPLKPAISLRRLKVISVFVYLSAFLISSPKMYFCFSHNHLSYVYETTAHCARTIIWYFLPCTIMAIIYWKMCRELIRQNNVIKSSNSNSKMTQSNMGKFNRLRHHRNWRTFLVSLATVLCFAVGGLPRQVGNLFYVTQLDCPDHRVLLVVDYGWVLQAVGTCALNPLIYGVLDKKLLSFLNCVMRNKRKQKWEFVAVFFLNDSDEND